jgi:hypothetical protein
LQNHGYNGENTGKGPVPEEFIDARGA